MNYKGFFWYFEGKTMVVKNSQAGVYFKLILFFLIAMRCVNVCGSGIGSPSEGYATLGASRQVVDHLVYYGLAGAQEVPFSYDPAISPNANKECKCNGKTLHGKVKIVTAFPDIKVQIVDAFADIHVKKVTSFADECGKWQFVDAFPDFTIRYVDAFPDLKIKFVESFPGMQ